MDTVLAYVAYYEYVELVEVTKDDIEQSGCKTEEEYMSMHDEMTYVRMPRNEFKKYLKHYNEHVWWMEHINKLTGYNLENIKQ